MNQEQFKDFLSANHFIARLRSTEELKDLPGNKFDIYLDGKMKFTGYVEVGVLPLVEDAEEGLFYILPDGTLNYISGGQWETLSGEKGDPGATFIPDVNIDGDISWTNNAGLPNPPTRNIMGPPGEGSRTYYTTGVLNTFINGFTTLSITEIPDVSVLADLKVNYSKVYDQYGTEATVIGLDDVNQIVRASTTTTAGSDRKGIRLGAVEHVADLPITSAQAEAMGWQIPSLGDFAYVREDEEHDDKLTEWFVTEITATGDYDWDYSHTLNAGDYQFQSLPTWDGLILTGSDYAGEFGTPIDPATLQKATTSAHSGMILVGAAPGNFGAGIDPQDLQQAHYNQSGKILIGGNNANDFGEGLDKTYYQKANTPAMKGLVLTGGDGNEFGEPIDLDAVLETKEDKIVAGDAITGLTDASTVSSLELGEPSQNNTVAMSEVFDYIKDKIINTWSTNFLNKVYPVGSIYMSMNSTSPAELFGGTWAAIQGGRFLKACGSGDTSGQTGGSEETTIKRSDLPQETITTSSSGSHRHNTQGYWGVSSGSAHHALARENVAGDPSESNNPIRSAGSHTHYFYLNGDVTQTKLNNLPPYLTVYMWRRTA